MKRLYMAASTVLISLSGASAAFAGSWFNWLPTRPPVGVPEPATLGLLGLGVVAAAAAARRKKK